MQTAPSTATFQPSPIHLSPTQAQSTPHLNAALRFAGGRKLQQLSSLSVNTE